jgi:ParB family transcriptional regulator, chromosome partitioning protein
LLDLLAFCTGTLLDGVTGTEGPHAINALSNALQLDMTRYWTPTRASYFDHVSKARIVDIAMQAVSPKIALDLSKMKKGDAAASAEQRLAKSAWLPEMLTDRDVPVARAYRVVSDPDEDSGDDERDTQEAALADPANTGSADPADIADDETRPAWPFPTAASINSQPATQGAA